MSNNRKERNLPNTSWTNLQNSFIDPSTIASSATAVATEGHVYTATASNATATSNAMYQQQQQQHNNVQQERYSVLPVGHGNFLKVYHTTHDVEQQSFNNYELFSNNSFINTNPINKTPSSSPTTTTSNGSAANMSYDVKKNFDNNENTTNMIINQLVTNWSPNLSGTYSPFGEQPQQQQQQQQQHLQQPSPNPHHHKFGSSATILNDIINQNQSSQSIINHPQQSMNSLSPKNEFASSSKTNINFENNNNTNNNNSGGHEIKKRIVAEVKPMRMSYSDVLSKNVTTNNKANGNVTMTTANPNTNNPSSETNTIPAKDKIQNDSKMRSVGISTITNEKNLKNDEKEKPGEILKQRKNDVQFIQQQQNFSARDKKKLQNTETIKDDSQLWKNKKPSSTTPIMKTKQKNSQINNTTENNTRKRSSKKEIEDDERTNGGNSSLKTNDKEGFYNVTKNDYMNNNGNNYSEKKSQYTNLKSTKSKLSSNSITKNNTSNNNNNIGNSIRFERQTYLSKRNHQKQKNIKYDLIKKFFEKWLEYTIKIISWLFYLIYDIIVLGCSMLYERFYTFYDIIYSYFQNFRNDFKNNSMKIWMKNLLKKFDSKFKKNSKFAIWRKFYNNFNNKKKSSSSEQITTDFYKNGRLPQTGDEAMYSLLNCKGKDAYSILGVTADSSQEQIRKHYKKIAVLVHPDKNKQPGAEEAFKVLQRAFELIGEPENRKKYDQSLAEALNAEKAWTELHDLLSQLQSKIAEAANTIRCSSCGLRHPRKLTERPHYAARECSSCKIRHSAREGDIWAETSIFGLRWKYLALMEGKVYDITEWANCQKGALSQLQPNSHIVQYRIVRGGQQQQQQQQQQYQQQTSQQDKEKLKKEMPSEPSLDEFLDNLYSGQNPQNQQSSSRKRTKRN